MPPTTQELNDAIKLIVDNCDIDTVNKKIVEVLYKKKAEKDRPGEKEREMRALIASHRQRRKRPMNYENK